MNTPQIRQKFTRNIQIAFTFLVLQFLVVSNGSAQIKFTLDNLPLVTSDDVDPKMVLNKPVTYDYTIRYPDPNNTNDDPNVFKSLKTDTDESFLCIGPSFFSDPPYAQGYEPDLIFGIGMNPMISNPLKIYGWVEVELATYSYNHVTGGKVFNIDTKSNSQCVVKGFQTEFDNNPNPASNIIYLSGFENNESSSVGEQVNPNLDITILKPVDNVPLGNNITISDRSTFSYRYKVTNVGNQPVIFDIADYFSQVTSKTTWSCKQSDGLTDCNSDANSPIHNPGLPANVAYNGAVYLKGVSIDYDSMNPNDFVIITVERKPIIEAANPNIDLLVSALITNNNDINIKNNSDTRSINGITNSLAAFVTPGTTTVITELSETIIEDSLSNIIALEVLDADASDELTVTATSVDTDIVLNNIMATKTGNGTWSIDIIPVLNANTVLDGAIDIQLHVNDTKNTTTIPLHLTITPANDPPTFVLATLDNHPAQSSGLKQVAMFMNMIEEGPTDDEVMTQSIIDNTPMDGNSDNVKVEFVSGEQGILAQNSLPLLGVDGTLSYFLSGASGGAATYRVVIQDDAGTPLDGSDDLESLPVEFSITVDNTPPTISLVDANDASISIDEDTISSSIGLKILDVETQNLNCNSISASSGDTNIIAVSGVAIMGTNTNCSVTITPVANQNTFQTSNVIISLTVNDGSSDSIPLDISVMINPVNDAPSFDLSGDIVWDNLTVGNGLKQHPGYANTFVMGPSLDEVNIQVVSMFNIVSITGDTAIFNTNPGLDNGGSLAYVLNGSGGTATIEISLTDNGIGTGSNVNTSASQTFTITVNSAPVASNVGILGVPTVGNILEGEFDYTDVDTDVGGIHTYKWYRNGSEISGATSITYTLVAADSGTNITFEVTPVAITGESIGSAVQSAGTTLINTAPTVSGAPASITVSENSASDLDLSGVTFADVDNDNLTVTLTINTGAFTTLADGSAVGSGVDETLENSKKITLEGSAADINSYLDTDTNIQYTGPAATLTISAIDGLGGSLVSDPFVSIITL